MTVVLTVRPATQGDVQAINRLLARAACLHLPGDGLSAEALLDETSLFLIWAGQEPRGLLGVAPRRPPVAEIRAVGLRYREEVGECLSRLLPPAEAHLRTQGVQKVACVSQESWLWPALQRLGFRLVNAVLLFEKRDWAVPEEGNRQVQIRPARLEDIPALVALDQAAFHELLWRNTPQLFQGFLARTPHFVVAELGGRVVGYEISDERHGRGHVVRVVVHPQTQGQGIGVRLLAEAVHFFRARGARPITLNTQRDNLRAQHLYRWFGFRPVGQEALVLEKKLGGEGEDEERGGRRERGGR